MKLNKLADLITENADLFVKNPDIKSAMTLIVDRLNNPRAFISFVGETSGGKSTLINALLGESLLPISVSPTTGTITEINNEPLSDQPFTVLYRDLGVEALTRDEFRRYAKEVRKDVLRLIVRKQIQKLPRDWTIIDTPGFDSVISEHEEVLSEFLPNSDAIAYVVDYKKGIGKTHLEYLKKIAELNVSDTNFPLFLIVNRVPSGLSSQDDRIEEILNSVQDVLHVRPPMVTVFSVIPDANGNKALPDISALRNFIQGMIDSDMRTRLIEEHLTLAVKEIAESVANDMRQKIDASNAPQQIKQVLMAKLQETPHMQANAEGLITSRVESMDKYLTATIARRMKEIIASVNSEIYSSSKVFDEQSCVNYIIHHKIQHQITLLSNDVMRYMNDEQKALDDELEKMLNRTILHVDDTVSLNNVEASKIKEVLAKTLQRIVLKALKEAAWKRLMQLGGRGGVPAGMGNGAKMLLKRIGDAFGHRFPREVYVEIGKVFNKQVVNVMARVIPFLVDIAAFAFHAARWQKKFSEQVETQFHKEIEPDFIKSVKESLRNMIVENKRTVHDVCQAAAEQYRTCIETANKKVSDEEIEQVKNELSRVEAFIKLL